ncbi:MAG: hypothetical protein LBN08_07020 [Lactobacillales bacterium]|jgi:very-short-patch-repair endonuclease|nr:hypothetical protein [Lactobacillales bacterium]
MKIENDVLKLLTKRRPGMDVKKFYKIGRGFYYPLNEWVYLYEIDRFKLRIIATASQTRGTAYFSGLTAAIIYGAPVPAGIAKLPFRPEITNIKSGRSKSKYVEYKSTKRQIECQCINLYGISMYVAMPAFAVAEMGKTDILTNIFPVADYLLREGRVSREEIDRALAFYKGTKGVGRAKKIAKLLSVFSESVAESVTKAIIVGNDLQLPVQQYVLGKYRIDFVWPMLKLILEFDGLEKLLNMGKKDIVENLEAMFERDDFIATNGFRVLHVLYSYLLYPEKLVTLLKKNGIPRHKYGL